MDKVELILKWAELLDCIGRASFVFVKVHTAWIRADNDEIYTALAESDMSSGCPNFVDDIEASGRLYIG